MDTRVSAVIDFMKANLHQSISVNSLAKAVHLSPSHLRQLFQQELTSSPARYLKRLRVHEAEKLLETTFLSVKEIAGQTGLKDVSHFIRHFERTHGVTPAQYRTRHAGVSQAEKTPRRGTKSANSPIDQRLGQRSFLDQQRNNKDNRNL